MTRLVREEIRIKNDRVLTIFCGLLVFTIYVCMYGFRKPYSVALYEGINLLGIDFKVMLVIAQLVGYTSSKFLGISYITGMNHSKRAQNILVNIFFAEMALVFFSYSPLVIKPLFMLVNGFFLGSIWGIVFSYIEGRRMSDFLNMWLSSSYIFASGFVKSIGAILLRVSWINEFNMPFIVGLVFVPILLLAVYWLDRMPAPNKDDIKEKTERVPMNKRDRRLFFITFIGGLLPLIVFYLFTTVYKEARDNFSSNIWAEYETNISPSVFTETEMIISIGVLLMLLVLSFIKCNRSAIRYIFILFFLGQGFIFISTFLFKIHTVGVGVWIIFSGIGVFMGIVPFTFLIDRLIALLKYKGTANYITYISDSFGYFSGVVFYFLQIAVFPNLRWSDVLMKMGFVLPVISMLIIFIAYSYFVRKPKFLIR
jgi:MFS family permease